MSQQSFESAAMESEAPAPQTTRMEYVKQSLNVYTVMLGVSFIALLAGTLILLFELRKWGDFPFESPWDTSQVQAPAAVTFDWDPTSSYRRA